MAILHSCCFWRSVRKGTYASAVYTLTYFAISSVSYLLFLHENQQYLLGKVDYPTGESFLERDTITSTTVIFNILLLSCAVFGIISSMLVIIGLKKEQRAFLLPWILVMVSNILVDSAHFVYLLILQKLKFEPLIATLFTVDFFIVCLNIYCLLCVISQYQEYKAGRGCAPPTLLSEAENVHYIPPTASTVGMSSIRQNKGLLSPICPHTSCTLYGNGDSQCSNNTVVGGNGHLKIDATTKPPYHRGSFLVSANPRKHVKFPEQSVKCCVSNSNGTRQVIMIDTLPEYSEDIMSWHEQYSPKE